MPATEVDAHRGAPQHAEFNDGCAKCQQCRRLPQQRRVMFMHAQSPAPAQPANSPRQTTARGTKPTPRMKPAVMVGLAYQATVDGTGEAGGAPPGPALKVVRA